MNRTKSEYGGFLPLELNPGVEYFAQYEPKIMRFNSVKASLAFLFDSLKCKTVWLPFYYCPSTIAAIKQMVDNIRFYHIDSSLMPVDIPDEEGDAVVLVDFFGVLGDKIAKYSERFKKAEVILDKAHAFFSSPVAGSRIHNVYSAKKFFGIPDGSYLVSDMAVSQEGKVAYSDSYSEFLTVAYEHGTNAAYRMKKNSDETIAANYDVMSELSRGLLKNVDYLRVETQRQDNFKFFRDQFEDINEIKINDNYAAYCYPLLISGRGESVKKKLVANKIFVSTLWLGEELLNEGNDFELDMPRNAVFLPIDQRYNLDDMKYIAECVKQYISEI